MGLSVALAITDLSGLKIHPYAQGLSKGDEHTTYGTLFVGYGQFTLPYNTHQAYNSFAIPLVVCICMFVCGTVFVPEISRIWLETLIDVIELLPKEVISKEVSFIALLLCASSHKQ